MIPIPSGSRVWIATGHTDMRRGMQGLALQVQEGLKRDPPRRRPFHIPGSPWRFGQDSVARRDRVVALRQASGPRKIYLAVGIGWCGVDLRGSDGLYAGRDRLAKSATDMAAQERRLSQIKFGAMCILGRHKSLNL